MKIFHIVVTFFVLCLLSGCTPEISSDHYLAENLGRVQRVHYGKIVQARTVHVGSHNNETGSLVGTAAGATAGSAIGGSTRANILGAIGGAVLGGIAGNEIGRKTGNQTGMQYIVRLDSGKTVSIVQGINPILHEGQRVMLLTGGRSGDRIIAA